MEALINYVLRLVYDMFGERVVQFLLSNLSEVRLVVGFIIINDLKFVCIV